MSTTMANYVCLLLDPDCKVNHVEILRAVNDTAATAAALDRAQQTRAWGYELWRGGRQIISFYDCKHPPARIAVVP